MSQIIQLTDKTENGNELRKAVFKIYAFNFLTNFHMFAGVLVPFFTIWAGLKMWQVMLLQAWFTFWVFILEVPTGVIADKLGRKVSLAAACVTASCGFFIYSFFPNFYAYIVGEFVLAISTCLLSGANEANLYDTIRDFGEESQSKKYIGRSESFILASIMIAAPIGSFLGDRLGLRIPMIYMFLPYLLGFVVALSFKRTSSDISRNKNETRVTIRSTIKHGIVFLVQHKILRLLALDSIIITVFGSLMVWMYQLLMQRSGFGLTAFGVVNTVFMALQIILLNFYGKIEAFIGSKKHVLTLCSVVMAVGILLCTFNSIPVLVVFGIVISIGFGMTRRPLIVNYLNKYIPSQERATVLSAVSMGLALFRIIANIVFGFLVEISYNAVLAGMALVIVLWAVFSRIEENHLID